MKKRGLVIGLLIMLAVITSGFTYAFWANGVLGNNDTAVGTINISEGEDVATTVNVADVTAGKELVPAGYVVDTNTQTDSAALQFSVAWTTASTALNGSTSVGDIVITSSVKFYTFDGTNYVEVLAADPLYAQIAAHVVVTADGGNASTITLGATATTINYNVTLLEPSNQTEYDFFANGKIEVTFTFTVNNVVTTNN
jgi:hypothetical protein